MGKSGEKDFANYPIFLRLSREFCNQFSTIRLNLRTPKPQHTEDKRQKTLGRDSSS